MSKIAHVQICTLAYNDRSRRQFKCEFDINHAITIKTFFFFFFYFSQFYYPQINMARSRLECLMIMTVQC